MVASLRCRSAKVDSFFFPTYLLFVLEQVTEPLKAPLPSSETDSHQVLKFSMFHSRLPSPHSLSALITLCPYLNKTLIQLTLRDLHLQCRCTSSFELYV